MANVLPRVRPNIAAMSAYVPGEQPGDDHDVIKLNQNENPYAPSPAVLPAIGQSLARLRCYPDSPSASLRRAAAELYGVPVEAVMAFNGSDEFLRLLFQAFAEEGDTVVSFAPSYTYYETLAAMHNVRFRPVEFTAAYGIPARLDLADAKLVFLPNPNAPSGTPYTNAEILRVVDAAPQAVVCIDEAYVDFAPEGTTALPLLATRGNLVVSRTFSKSYALAGLRAGLGFAAPSLAAEMDKIRDYYNLDVLAQAGAEAALHDQSHLATTVGMITATRERLSAELRRRGYHVWSSAANFVLARVPGGAGEACRRFEALRQRRIYVRYFQRPRLDDCLRISIGTDAEIDRLLAALDDIG